MKIEIGDKVKILVKPFQNQIGIVQEIYLCVAGNIYRVKALNDKTDRKGFLYIKCDIELFEKVNQVDKYQKNKSPFVYIRGVYGKGKKVIAELKKRGGKEPRGEWGGENDKLFYSIDNEGFICSMYAEYITDFTKKNYTEIFLK